MVRQQKPAAVAEVPPRKVEANIRESIRSLAVPIARLNPDPKNARVHDERNVGAIARSLERFGQTKPVVVRRKGMVVVAGNGTLQAARRLGWTEVAASVVDMTEKEAAAYAIADNRSGELADWDLETLADVVVDLRADFGDVLGWDPGELDNLLDADFGRDDGGQVDFEKEPEKPREASLCTVALTAEQMRVALEALKKLRADDPKLTFGGMVQQLATKFVLKA